MTSPSKTKNRARRLKANPAVQQAAVAAWRAEVTKLQNTINRLKAVPSMHGDKWTAAQVEYFELRLRALKDRKPQ